MVGGFANYPFKQQSDPWVNSELLEVIEQRDHNLKLFRKSKLSQDYKNYLQFRNQVDYTTKCAKSMSGFVRSHKKP